MSEEFIKSKFKTFFSKELLVDAGEQVLLVILV